MATRQKPATMNAETNGRRKLPGRVVLFGLVAFAVIFLDFESNSLANYGTKVDSTTDFDAHQVAVASPGTTSKSHADDDLGRLQRYQLQQQWLDYMKRMNDSSTQLAEPETIEIDPEPLQHYVDGNHSTNSSMYDTESDSTNYLNVGNVSVEEIVAIDESNITEAEQQNFDALLSSVSDTVPPENSTIASLEELITVENSSQCFPYNSNEWLHGSRWSNADSNLTDDFVYKQMKIPNPLDPEWFSHLSSQTICHADSKFRNPFSTVDWDATNEKLIDEWEFRLLYMAIHHHQHEPAILEANARQACPNEELLVSKMDYECPSSKFLVSNIVPTGLGISIRKGAVNTMLMAIATNRVAIFVNNFSGGPSFFETNFPSQSCHRGDIQCFYLPPTPCTALVDDLKSATILPEEGVRDLLRRGRIRIPTYSDARVLAMESILDPLNQPSMHVMIQSRLHTIALQLIDGIRSSAPPEQILVLETAAARIKMDNSNDSSNNSTSIYDNRYAKAAHAALMYLMRPNAKYQQISDEIVAHAIPKDLDQSLSIGLPIFGASDDCIADGRCHGFDTYMTLVRRLWDEQGMESSSTGKKGALFLTADDAAILSARHAYKDNESFPFRFIINDNVTLQDPDHIDSDDDEDEDFGLLPTLTSIVSLKMLLHSNILIGNCCSSSSSSAAYDDLGVRQRRRDFHHAQLALLDLFHEGCGAVPNGQIVCLQEYPDPQFHLQCPPNDLDFNKTIVR